MPLEASYTSAKRWELFFLWFWSALDGVNMLDWKELGDLCAMSLTVIVESHFSGTAKGVGGYSRVALI